MEGQSGDGVGDWQAKWLELSSRSGILLRNFMVGRSYLSSDSELQFDPLNLSDTFYRLSRAIFQDPRLLWTLQMDWWRGYMDIWRSSLERFGGDGSGGGVDGSGDGGVGGVSSGNIIDRDKRFRDEAWENNAIYNYLKESYLLSSRVLLSAVEDSKGFSDSERRRLIFYVRQFTDALSPSNFAFTNPEVVRATYESGGENLVNGLENLLEDLESGEGSLRISMTDSSAFEVGVNLATSRGEVIFQNDLMQLIQYSPLSADVHSVPLLIIPPWINKYYILDLSEENSFIRYIVEAGFTVFVISWVNPDESHRDKNFEDYMVEGALQAISVICDSLCVGSVNVLGYCIGGTLLASTLAYMAVKGDDRVSCATYLTTLLDFEDAGDLKVFIDEQQLKRLEQRMDEIGYLEGEEMASTFNMLRSNDLIWSFVVNNYLLGRDPLPFDLLYWNSDSTRMPSAMHSYYLRRMYLENLLCRAGGIVLAGVPIDLGMVRTPSFVLSAREDHIAPWRATYEAVNLFSGSVRFVLAGSGHIAGVVNPPHRCKYGYWSYNRKIRSADDWLLRAEEHSGSWWDEWLSWLGRRSGGMVLGRVAGGGRYGSIEPAPGSYVRVRS